jgi:hypothetical protein
VTRDGGGDLLAADDRRLTLLRELRDPGRRRDRIEQQQARTIVDGV